MLVQCVNKAADFHEKVHLKFRCDVVEWQRFWDQFKLNVHESEESVL